jgi:hypothetical protein
MLDVGEQRISLRCDSERWARWESWASAILMGNESHRAEDRLEATKVLGILYGDLVCEWLWKRPAFGWPE